MAYKIYLPPSIYSLKENINDVNTVQNLDIVNGSVHVGNYYVPINQILLIEEV